MTAIELGFKDEAEMQLYKDVCCTNGAVTSPKTLEELCENLRSDVEHEDNKKAYEGYMRVKGLFDLLSKVKDMPLLDRLIEVHFYYINIEILNRKCQKELFETSEPNKEMNTDISETATINEGTGYIDLTFYEIMEYIHARVRTMPLCLQKQFYGAVNYSFKEIAKYKKQYSIVNK